MDSREGGLMNEAEQFARLHTMSKAELIKWQKYLAKNIAEIESSIADTDKWSERNPEWKDCNEATNHRRRARMATRRRRLAQIERRIAEIESGAAISTEPVAEDKEAKRVWRRLVAQKREAFLYAEYSRKHGLRFEGFEKRIAEIEAEMKAIAGGQK